MPNYAILRVEKVKTFDGAKALENHNNREMDCPHANPDFLHLNQQLEGTDDVKVDIQRILNKNGITKIRKDGVLALDFILSASPGYFGSDKEDYKPVLNDPKLIDWVSKSVNFIHGKFGENVAQVHLHMDEKTPHLHVLCIPVVENHSKAKIKRADRIPDPHKLAANRWVNGRTKLRELQKDYYEAVKDLGLAQGVKNTKNSNKLYKERASRELEEQKIKNQQAREENERLRKELERYKNTGNEYRTKTISLFDEVDNIVLNNENRLKEVKKGNYQTKDALAKAYQEIKKHEEEIKEAERKLDEIKKQPFKKNKGMSM